LPSCPSRFRSAARNEGCRQVDIDVLFAGRQARSVDERGGKYLEALVEAVKSASRPPLEPPASRTYRSTRSAVSVSTTPRSAAATNRHESIDHHRKPCAIVQLLRSM
jgi:hypothetical protein